MGMQIEKAYLLIVGLIAVILTALFGFIMFLLVMELIYFLIAVSAIAALGCIWGIIQLNKTSHEETGNIA